jgi:hypothetical protein
MIYQHAQFVRLVEETASQGLLDRAGGTGRILTRFDVFSDVNVF